MAYTDKTRGMYGDILTGLRDAGLFKTGTISFIPHRQRILKWSSPKGPR